LRHGLGDTAHPAVNQAELQKLAEPFYHSQAEGGEGYMEVGKNIYYASNNMAHMVLSLKPFGCMPSTQSDGAQAAVTSAYPDMIFLPIETSGEGDINAYSRTQMALGEAKVKCKNEMQEVATRAGYPLAQIQQYAAEHKELRRPIQHIPHQKGVIGQGASFVLHVASLMKAAGVQPKTA
jgi:predicted nucleotide-binding protein (sugar kinase/HSP70/actin superfamily)